MNLPGDVIIVNLVVDRLGKRVAPDIWSVMSGGYSVAETAFINVEELQRRVEELEGKPGL